MPLARLATAMPTAPDPSDLVGTTVMFGTVSPAVKLSVDVPGVGPSPLQTAR